MMRYAKEGVGERMVDVVGSISRINQERYQDTTMLANYGHIPATLETPEEILKTVEALQKDVAGVPGREGVYLRGMLAAFRMYAQVLDGQNVPYADAVRVMQQAEPRPIPAKRYQELSASIGEELGRRGYRGGIGAQVQAWLKDTRIPAEQVSAVAYQFLGKAKEAAVRRVVQLPPEDSIDAVKDIRGVFWSGYSRYLGDYRGDLTFNIDRPWSLPTFGNILCHEGYPGHQAFYCHWDDLYRQGKLPLEAAYYSTAGNPANPMFEGSPECGLHFLGWDDPDEDTPELTAAQKADFALGRQVLDLQRLLQTQACLLYHIGGDTHEQVVKYMLSTGIYNEVEAENTFRFFSHPVQKYYYTGYYYGRWMIYEGYSRVPKEKRRAFFHMLYDLPQTNETFIAGVETLTGKPFAPFEKW